MLTYILEVTLCWSILFAVFYLALRKLTFFRINRWYLLLSLIAGILIPLLKNIEINLYQQDVAEIAPLVYVIKDAPSQIAVSVTSQSVDRYELIPYILIGIYLIGLSFFIYRFMSGLSAIRKLYLKGSKFKKERHTIIRTNEDHLPFSFFTLVFISDKIPLKEEYDQIIKHEITHVEGWHSADILFLELINMAWWFNPLIYLYKTALRQTHEFLADHAVLENTSRKKYGTLLLKQSLSGLQIALTHQFFHSHIKKRINMMYQKKSERAAWMKYLLVLPILVVFVLAFTSSKNNLAAQIQENKATVFWEVPDSIADKMAEIAIIYPREGTAPNFNDLSELSYAGQTNIEIRTDKGRVIKLDPTHNYNTRDDKLWADDTQDYNFKNIEKYLVEILKNAQSEGSVLTSWRINLLYKLFVWNNTERSNEVPAFFKKTCADQKIEIELQDERVIDIEFPARIEKYPQRYRNKSYLNETAFNEIDEFTTRFKDRKLRGLDHAELNLRYQTLLKMYPGHEWDIMEVFNKYMRDQFNAVATFLPRRKPLLNVMAPEQLKKYANEEDPSKAPYLWVEGVINDLPLSKSVDLSKPIGKYTYLAPDKSIRIFGDKAKYGFYALYDVSRPLDHPETINHNLEKEIENFFSSFPSVPKERWSVSLKKFSQYLTDKYSVKNRRTYNYVTSIPTALSTASMEYDLALIFKEGIISKVYERNEEGHVRIDAKEDKDHIPCKPDENGHVFFINESFGMDGCGQGEKAVDCILEKVQTLVNESKSFPLAARKAGFQGLTYFELDIDEKGRPVGFEQATKDGSPYGLGLQKEGEVVFNHLKENLQFQPPTCYNIPQKTQIPFKISHELSKKDIRRVPVRNKSNVAPEQNILINAITDEAVHFHYQSNMNVPVKFNLIDPSGKKVGSLKIDYVYNEHYDQIPIENLKDGSFTIVAIQDGLESTASKEIKL